MMKVFLYSLLLLGTTATAQKLPELTSRVRLSDSSGSILAELSDETSVKKAKSGLTYHWYSANAIHTTRGGFSGKLLDGKYTEFYPNKNLRRQGQYQSGLTTGTWKEWNTEGDLLAIYNWKDGKLSGPFSQYDNKGKLLEEGTYTNGLLQGMFKHYNGIDSVTNSYYKNGRIVPVPKPFLKRIRIFHKKQADSSAVKANPL